MPADGAAGSRVEGSRVEGSRVEGSRVEGSRTDWETVLDDLQARLVQYQRALQAAAPMPGPYVAPEPDGPMPARLATRARMILAGQRDVEYQLRARMGALGAVLSGCSTATPAPTPLFVDRRS